MSESDNKTHTRKKKDSPRQKAKSLKVVFKPSKGQRKQSFGARLREQTAHNVLLKTFTKMEKENLSMSDLAEFLGISFQTVSRWYNGHRNPQGKTLALLQTYLATDLSNIDYVLDSNTKIDNKSLSERKQERSSLNGPSLTGRTTEFHSDLDNREPSTDRADSPHKKNPLVIKVRANRNHIPSKINNDLEKDYRS